MEMRKRIEDRIVKLKDDLGVHEEEISILKISCLVRLQRLRSRLRG